jgi:hypothetical protein
VRLYVSGATDTLRRLGPKHPDLLGAFPVPTAGNNPLSIASLNLPVAADNGAFGEFKPARFAAMLAAYADAGVRLEWVACPDVVCDAVGTWRRWQDWAPRVRAFGFRPAMVLQNGMTLDAVLDFDPPAVFVGGDDAFKEGKDARAVVRWARSKGRPAHMGRVNSRRRIEYALGIGCTSCDGSGFSKWPDTRIPLYLRWVRRTRARNAGPGLFATARSGGEGEGE